MTSPAPRSKRLRWLLGIGSSMIVILLLVGLLFPYMLKRYIEEHSEAWIHRKVTIDRIVLNPFNFRYAVTGVTCFEPESDVVFVSWKNISLRSNLWAGFQRNDWRFRNLRIESPYFHVVQNGDRFNFSDLMELGGDEEAVPDTAAPVRFSMEAIQITDGRIAYASDLLHAPIGIEHLDATCSVISSQRARMDFKLGFDLESGGRMDGGFMYDPGRSLYSIDAHLRAFRLEPMLPYLQDLFACNALNGAVDLDLALMDSYADSTSLSLSSRLTLNDVALIDPNNEDLFRLKKANAKLDTLVAKDQRIEVGEVVLDGADLRFVLLEDGADNWTRLMKLDTNVVVGDSMTTEFSTSESNVFVMLADYLSYLGEQIVASEYTAKQLALKNSSVYFEDHTPEQPFRYSISHINVEANRITTAEEAGRITASAVLQETGKLESTALFDPKNIRNVSVEMDVADMQLNALDAYGRWYSAHPFEDGVLSYTTKTVVKDGMVDSQNHLNVDKLKIGRMVKEHDPEIYVLPLRLAAGLLKDVNGVVELDVPVKGDLNDPEFKTWPIIWQVLKNLVVKAASAPGRLLMRAVGGADEEDLERVRFEYLQQAPNAQQKKTLKQLASALKSKPELAVDLVPTVDRNFEAKEVAVFQAKKTFLFPEQATLDAADSTHISDLGARDTVFAAYVEGRSAQLSGKSLQDRCMVLLGAEEAERIAGEIEAARRERIMEFLLAEGVEAPRLRFRDGTAEELAGQVGVPGYRFVYDVGE